MAKNCVTWILLRGWIRHHGHWFCFEKELAKYFQSKPIRSPLQVHTIDLLGNGQFCHYESPKRIVQQSRHLQAQIREADQGGPIYIIAVSMSSLVALEALHSTACTHSEVGLCEVEHWHDRVAGMVLINPSARGLSTVFERLRPHAWPTLVKQIAWLRPKQLERDLVKLTVNNQRLCSLIIKQNQFFLQDFPISKRNALNQLISAARFTLNNFPDIFPKAVLVLSSQGDHLVAWTCGARLAHRLGAHFALHPNAGHDLTTDASAWVLDQIDQWLERMNLP